MGVSYNRLWKLLIDKGLKKTQLKELAGMSPATLAKLSKNEFVSMEVITKICSCLSCGIEDVVEYIPDTAAVL